MLIGKIIQKRIPKEWHGFNIIYNYRNPRGGDTLFGYFRLPIFKFSYLPII
jgi:hypothetical protein